MWDPRRLTTLWAFMACYRDSFIFFYLFLLTEKEWKLSWPELFLFRIPRILKLFHFENRCPLWVLSYFVGLQFLIIFSTFVSMNLRDSCNIICYSIIIYGSNSDFTKTTPNVYIFFICAFSRSRSEQVLKSLLVGFAPVFLMCCTTLLPRTAS
jgi:hypothetical protein